MICELGRSSCWSCFCFDCCLQRVIYPATLHRLLQIAMRLFFLSAAFKRGRFVNCLLWLLWIALACSFLSAYLTVITEFSQAGYDAVPALPHVHVHSRVHHPLGSSHQGAALSSDPGQLLGLSCCRFREENPTHLPSGECIACEKPTQQGGHPLREKSPWTVLFLTARENTDIYLWHWCQVTFRPAHAQELFGLEREEKESS